MDVVLELLDTYVYDALYANVLPLTPKQLAFSSVSDFAGVAEHNATWSSMRELGTPAVYKFEPASQYFSVQPSSYAFMSRWPRDNIYRQAVSLYLTTWYAPVLEKLSTWICD